MMQNFRNYFAILGVDQGASSEEVKQAYRQMARKYHPDLNPGDKQAEETFKLLGEAYEVLSEPAKRAQYEEYSRFWNQKGFRPSRSKGAGPFPFSKLDFGEFGDFNRFVDQLLNRRGESQADPPNRPSPMPDTGRAAAGAEPYQSKRPRSSTARATAAPDRPTGDTKRRRRSPDPLVRRRDTEANLTLPLEKAYNGGQERIRLEDGRSLEVDMPPGMVTGQRIRLKGQGMGGGISTSALRWLPIPSFPSKAMMWFVRFPLPPARQPWVAPSRCPP
jgi:curved DNA-binding protein